MAGRRAFLRQFLRTPGTIGAVAPSSRALARTMLATVDFDHLSTIVEFGPGTGVFSREIIERLSAETLYFALEVNATMVTHLRRALPSLRVYQDSAAEVGAYLRHHGAAHADVIVSGLPWAAFAAELQEQLLAAAIAALPPGGQFLTFAYLQGLLLPAGKRFAARLYDSFTAVDRSPVVWANMPPAFVYRCRR